MSSHPLYHNHSSTQQTYERSTLCGIQSEPAEFTFETYHYVDYTIQDTRRRAIIQEAGKVLRGSI